MAHNSSNNNNEILVIPFPHPGHLFPATELCNKLASKNHTVSVFYPSSSSPPSPHPSIRILRFPLPDSVHFPHHSLDDIFPILISDYFNSRDPSDFPLCVILDDMIASLLPPLLHFNVPLVTLFTSSAASSALNHAMTKMRISPDDLLPPGKILAVPGLPDEMALTSSSLLGLPGPPPPGVPHPRRRPPPPDRRNGRRPPRRGLDEMDGVAAMLFNTCADLERPFLDYLAKECGKPVWGVGPLVPARFRDGEVRSKRESNVSEEEVIEWLDSKPRGSVIYVSFGSIVSPPVEELTELAAGLVQSNRPFIWVVQTDQNDAMDVGPNSEGLVIRGWAPQLTILSHVATGGYVCHCGWNSTVEAMECGVPMLTWPVRGDQHHNAKLVTCMLKVGLALKEEGAVVEVKRGDVVRGIERLMGDEGIKKRATAMRAVFDGGFPASSLSAIDSFLDFVKRK